MIGYKEIKSFIIRNKSGIFMIFFGIKITVSKRLLVITKKKKFIYLKLSRIKIKYMVY